MARIHFNNAIGEFELSQSKRPHLIINLEPSDEHTDIVSIDISNLKYVGLGRYTDQSETYYEYTFGKNDENKLSVITMTTPEGRYGRLIVETGLIHISRISYAPDITSAFEFFTELHNALQAEVKRQARIRARNLLAFQQVLQGREQGEQKVPERLKDPGNVASVIGSFLSGEPGSIPQQVAKLKEKASRRKTRRRS